MKKIIIIDDHLLVREGMKSLLESTGEYRVIAEFPDGSSFLRNGNIDEVDLILLDIAMPGRSGLEILREIRKKNSAIPVIIVSMHPEEDFSVKAIQSGANGYLSKTSIKEEILGGIDTVLRGGLYLTGAGKSILAERLEEGGKIDKKDILADLSARETEVMLFLCRGKTIKEIAWELNISNKTVSTYKTRVMEKTGTKTLAELIKLGIEHAVV